MVLDLREGHNPRDNLGVGVERASCVRSAPILWWKNSNMHWTPTEYRNAATSCDSPVLAETCMAAFSQANAWRYCFSIFPVTIPKDRTLLLPFPRWKNVGKV